MNDGIAYVCELCREPVEPDAPDVVRAYEVVRGSTFAGDDERIEGPNVFFHERHFPVGSRTYRRSV